MTREIQPLLLDLKATAQMLGVDYGTARLYVEKGLLRAVRLPSLARSGESRRKIQVRLDEVERFISECESGSTFGTVNQPEPPKVALNQRCRQATNEYQKGWDERLKR
jgi:hypothetical protein